MFILSIPFFNGGYDALQFHSGGGQLPAEARAVAIASSSLIDACAVGGRALGVGHVLPVSGGDAIAPIRGFATGGLATVNVPNFPSVGGEINTPLELLVWTCGEQPFKPGPLATREYGFEADKAILDTVNYRRILRIPTQGRAMTADSIPIARVTGAGTTPQVSIIVRGVRYLDRATALADQSKEPINRETVATPVAVAATTSNGDPAGVLLVLPTGIPFDEYQIWALDTGTAWAGRFAVNVTPTGMTNNAA